MHLKTANTAISAAVPGATLHFPQDKDRPAASMFFMFEGVKRETSIPWLNRLSLDEWVELARESFGYVEAKESRLATLNRDQLREIAKKAKLAGYSRMNASQLREALSHD